MGVTDGVGPFAGPTIFVHELNVPNMMDYEPGKKRLSYWQWQWRLLQADVANYYGTKTAAQ